MDTSKKTLTRSEAIVLLRQRCAALVDADHSLCQVAARLKILCGGFSQWTFTELRQRYGWIARTRPGVTRKELEDLGNRWQLARQDVLDRPISCDVQMNEKQHRICDGWTGHSEEDLARFCHELTGEEYVVIRDPVREADPARP